MRPARLVISDDNLSDNKESNRVRSVSVSSAESLASGNFMSIVPSHSNQTSPDYLSVSLNVTSNHSSNHSSSTTSTTSTYNTPSAIPQSLTNTLIDPNLASARYNYILPSPTQYSTLYPSIVIIPGPDNPTQPSPPNNNTIRSPQPIYPTTITLSTIVPTLHSSNTSTTTTFTTVNTTASTSLVHSTPITSPISCATSKITSSPKLAPLFQEHPFQRPITPYKKVKTTRQTTTDTETETDQMDYESPYVLSKNKRTK